LTKWKTSGLQALVLGAAAIVVMGAAVAGSQFRQVDIVVQGPKHKRHLSIWTFSQTVKGILHKAGVPTNRHDVIKPDRTVTAGHPIIVRKAVPVTVLVDNRRIHVWTTRYNVQAVLSAAKIKMSPLDLVRPALNAKITTSTTVNVIRRWWVTKRIRQRIPFGVRHVPDPYLPQGRVVIHRPGQFGERVKIVRDLMQAGKVVKSQVIGLHEWHSARWEIIYYGTAHPISRGTAVPQFSNAIPMVSTAYWPDPAWSTGYTATGVRAGYGIAAVDPAVIPLGTRLYIPGYGFAVAADVGGAIVGDRIDLCYDDAQQAIDWGVRDVTVYILSSY
jgi:uncharacterized protein YabE (DUF348 family)